MEYIILIPAYEPDDKLIKLVKKIDNKYKIVIVDDGSSDKSIFDKVKKYAYIISYDNNMGKGYALKTGLKYIKENYKNYVVVCVDADMQHDINDAVKLCDYAKEHKDTLVIGRRHWDKSTPFTNRMGNKITRYVFKKKTGLSIYDTQSGLRAFSYKLVDYMLNVPGNRYEYEMNVLLYLTKNNTKFHEIDIKTIYIGDNSTSHFKAFKDSYRIYKEIIKYNK